MYKAYYSHLENTYEEDNESLSSSFWTDQESEDMGECYVKDDRIETELGIYKQEINKEEERYVKDDSVKEQTGEKLQEGEDCRNEEDKQCYVKEQSKDEDSGKLRGEQVSQHDNSSVKATGKEKRKSCKSGSEDEEREDYIKEGCAGEEMSESDVEENSEEEQSECFVNDKNMNMSLEEESESDDLESEEEIEYFASGFSQSEMKGGEPEGEKLERDEEWKAIFVNQDDISNPVMDDEQTGAEGGQISKEEQYPERRMSFMAEQHSSSSNKSAIWVNVDSTDEGECADQIYTKHKENNGSAEQIWECDADLHENAVYAEDLHGSTSSLTASILTSGYGTYKPDSPKDDLDVRDDCSLFGLELDTEYPNALYTQHDPNLSWYRDHLSSEVAEQQIPSVSLGGGDWTPFESFIAGDSTVYNDTNSVQGTTDENRLRSTTIGPEDSQTLSLSAESVDLSASEEKATNSVHLQVPRTNNRNVAFCSEDWEDVETFSMCNNDVFNIRLNEYMTKDHRTEDGHARQDFRKTKQVKSHLFRRG